VKGLIRVLSSLAVADVNGDGRPDLVVSAAVSYSISTFTGVVDVLLGNGDGRADLIGRALQTGQWFAGLSTGATLRTSFWDAWSTAVTWQGVQLGDSNGDGKQDLVGRTLQTGQWFVSLSDGAMLHTSQWDVRSPAVSWADVRHGTFV
jgi:hypothetical protein